MLHRLLSSAVRVVHPERRVWKKSTRVINTITSGNSCRMPLNHWFRSSEMSCTVIDCAANAGWWHKLKDGHHCCYVTICCTPTTAEDTDGRRGLLNKFRIPLRGDGCHNLTRILFFVTSTGASYLRIIITNTKGVNGIEIII